MGMSGSHAFDLYVIPYTRLQKKVLDQVKCLKQNLTKQNYLLKKKHCPLVKNQILLFSILASSNIQMLSEEMVQLLSVRSGRS